MSSKSVENRNQFLIFILKILKNPKWSKKFLNKFFLIKIGQKCI